LHAPRWGDPTLPESGVNPSTLEERSANLAMIYGFLLPAFVERLGARLEPEILKVIEDAAPVIGAWALGSGTPLTVAHYDFRPDNFMFAREPDAPPLVVVDWHTVNEVMRRGVERGLERRARWIFSFAFIFWYCIKVKSEDT